MASKVFLLYAETQIHAGRGAEVGIVDLPIQRERTTRFPIIQGIKGALRSNIKDEELKVGKEKIFGSEPSDGGTLPGRLAFSEAKILLFPVRNPEQLFVWVTCPLVLIRFLKSFNSKSVLNLIENIEKNSKFDDETALTTNEKETIWLEEIRLKAQKAEFLSMFSGKISESVVTTGYIKEKLKKDLVVVSDNMFSRIVETMTEVVPRIRISEKGVVETGALWYEEYLPQDTVMYFVVRETAYSDGSELQTLGKVLNGRIISVGGKETVGKGLAMVSEVVFP
ncbi:MAG: type III-B CRISPR module RAMP protein Cmr4 [Pseudothermotoga sp.]|nr:type III-B CRISPR module RAMP protein Cmr4 [Pseudothermotoga sp.]